MNLKVEHGIIAILLIAFLYYFYKHQSLLSDLSRVPAKGNAELKAINKIAIIPCSTLRFIIIYTIKNILNFMNK